MTDTHMTRDRLAQVTPRTFIVEHMSHGRPEKTVDLNRFSSALAESLAAIGFNAVVVPGAYEADATVWRALVRLTGDHAKGGGLDLFLTTDHPSKNHNGKVSVAASVNNVARRDITTVSEWKMPSAQVSVDRSLDALARDVARRVIEPAIEPAARVREYAKMRQDERNQLDLTVAALEQRFPDMLKITKHDDGLSAQVQIVPHAKTHRDFFYLWGSIGADGRFTQERMQTLSPELYVDFLALIRRHYPAQRECECFGESGVHASTHIPQGSTREHCDICGRPVRAVVGIDSLVDVLRSYVSPDDVTITDRKAFLALVADRIKDDIA